MTIGSTSLVTAKRGTLLRVSVPIYRGPPRMRIAPQRSISTKTKAQLSITEAACLYINPAFHEPPN